MRSAYMQLQCVNSHVWPVPWLVGVVVGWPARKDCILVPRSVMSAILDHLDRGSAAAGHAVRISASARDAFESEHRKLQDISHDVRKLLDRF